MSSVQCLPAPNITCRDHLGIEKFFNGSEVGFYKPIECRNVWVRFGFEKLKFVQNCMMCWQKEKRNKTEPFTFPPSSWSSNKHNEDATQGHGKGWDLKAHPIPSHCHGQGHLPLDQSHKEICLCAFLLFTHICVFALPYSFTFTLPHTSACQNFTPNAEATFHTVLKISTVAGRSCWGHPPSLPLTDPRTSGSCSGFELPWISSPVWVTVQWLQVLVPAQGWGWLKDKTERTKEGWTELCCSVLHASLKGAWSCSWSSIMHEF